MRVAILLAAGASRRFGSANKLFARHRGQTLLDRALRIVAQAPAQRTIVVTGNQAQRVTAAVRRAHRHAIVIRAVDFEEGMGASLRAAARGLRPIDTEALVFLADMPWLSARLARQLVGVSAIGDEVVRPVWRGRLGHPVLLRGAALRSLSQAAGEEGLRRAGRVRMVAADRRCIADVDRPSMLSRSPPAMR